MPAHAHPRDRVDHGALVGGSNVWQNYFHVDLTKHQLEDVAKCFSGGAEVMFDRIEYWDRIALHLDECWQVASH